MDNFGLHKDDKFVDIHGREIPTITLGPHEETVCLLSDLKQTGAAIFQKSHFAKLSTIKPEFDEEFVDHMLEAAKSYMLANKCSFTHHQIMGSIEYCKEQLSDREVATTSQKLFKNRKVTDVGDDMIIKVTNQKTPKPKIKTPAKVVTPQDHAVRPPKKRIEFGDTSQKNGSKFSKSPKKFTYNTTQEQHEVLVTAIDKLNCIWVRDVANEELLEKIHRRVSEEVKFQRAAPKPWVMDRVYIAPDEGSWYRCKILKYTPLTVFFLDYGNIAEVPEIRNVSEELANTPCLAVRITFRESEYKPRLEDVICIKRFFKNDDGTFFVNILKQPTQSATPMISETPFEAVVPTENTETTIERPPFFGEVRHDQRVTISHLKNDEFFLRTKQCFDKEKEIEEELKQCAKTAVKVNPKINQIVMYQDTTKDKFYRAVIKKFSKTKAEIELLETAEDLTVSLSSLRTLDGAVRNKPVTYIKGGKLAGFENETLSRDCRKYINSCIQKRLKFTVVLGFDDELDLHDGTELLSLRLLDLTPQKIFLKDMKTFKPETGIKAYLCGYYKDSDNLTLVPKDELEQHIDVLTRTKIADQESYVPETGEVCLCFYVDYWYRCVVTRVFEKDCEVLLLDFGNVELIKMENLRRPGKQITDVPAMGIPCVLTGLPPDRDVSAALRSTIIKGEFYNVDVKKIEAGKCHVELPKVYEKIRDLL